MKKKYSIWRNRKRAEKMGATAQQTVPFSSSYKCFDNLKFIAKVAGRVDKGLLPTVFVLTVMTILISLLAIFMLPQILKTFMAGKELSEIIKVILFFGFGWLFCDAVFTYGSTILRAKKIFFRLELLQEILLKSMRMSYPLTYSKEVGSIKEKSISSMNDNSSKIEKIWEYLIHLGAYSILTVLYVLLLSALPWPLIGLTILTTFLSFYVGKPLRQWRYDHKETEGKHLKHLYYVLRFSDNHQNIKDIRMFGLNQWLDDIYQSVMQLHDDFYRTATKKEILADGLVVLFQLLRNVLTYYYLISMVVQGQIEVPMFLLYFNAQTKFAEDMSRLLTAVNLFYAGHLEISTIRQFLDYPEIFCFEKGRELIVDKNDIQIELRNVSFRYTEDGENILENINFKISAGEKVSVVGLNGAGKSTFIKLICGLLDPSEGEVLLNGINIKEFNRNEYYQIFSAVFQEHSVFAGKLSWNIANSLEHIDGEKLERAIALSDLTGKVKTLKDGADTYIVKEVYHEAPEFSGGEMQKILLARAIYRDSPVLILDEPTAALDAIAEKAIYEKYNELTKGMMSLFISHRLASTQFCDYIVLIENKGIAEKGTHQELMNLNGRYRYLYEVQSKYYREEVVR